MGGHQTVLLPLPRVRQWVGTYNESRMDSTRLIRLYMYARCSIPVKHTSTQGHSRIAFSLAVMVYIYMYIRLPFTQLTQFPTVNI